MLGLGNEGNFDFRSVNAVESGLFVPTDVKNLRIIDILGKPHILVGNNNDESMRKRADIVRASTSGKPCFRKVPVTDNRGIDISMHVYLCSTQKTEINIT